MPYMELITTPSAPTETTVAGIAKGDATYRLVGSYVTSPMNWSVARAVFLQWNNNRAAGP